MKQYWQRIALRIDALTLRERAIVFALAALVVITLVNEAILEPLFRQQKSLARQISDDQAKIVELQQLIQQKAASQAADPDAENRQLLNKLLRQSNEMQASLHGIQKGFVAPDKMPDVLESILKRNGSLRLVSLKSLPPAGLSDSIATDGKNENDKGDAAATQAGSKAAMSTPQPAQVFKHGVEIAVQGSYLDMVRYMADLEALPWQLLWGKARLDVEEYPTATLTLTLYTLSLDKKWLNI